MRNETRAAKGEETRNVQRPTLNVEGSGDGKPGRCFASVTGPQSPTPRARSPAFGRRGDPRCGGPARARRNADGKVHALHHRSRRAYEPRSLRSKLDRGLIADLRPNLPA